MAIGILFYDIYLINIPQTPKRSLAAASNLVPHSENLVKDDRIEEAIQGFTDAKRWNPNLKFDPVNKAHQLAKERQK